jgi:hypothetical protein
MRSDDIETGMSRHEYNQLHAAFSRIFTDLVSRGMIEGDQAVLDEFWREFLADLRHFPNSWTRALMS